MSGGGRGTRRASPYQGNAPSEPLFLAPGPEGTWSYYVPPEAKWQRRLDLTSPPNQLLTAAYEPYAYLGATGTEFSIPYGGVRLSVICTYTPGVASGQLGASVRWLSDTGDRIPTLVMSDASTASFGVAGDATSAEVDTFEHDVVTPAAPDVSPIIFRIPFWIPPVEFSVNLAREANSRMEIFVREASGLAEGSVAVNRLLIESFGEARPVASLP